MLHNDCPQTYWLKHASPRRFCGSGTWCGVAGHLAQGHIHRLPSRCCQGLKSHSGLAGEKSTAGSFMGWCKAGGLSVHTPQELLARDCPRFLVTWTTPQGSWHHGSVYSEQTVRKARGVRSGGKSSHLLSNHGLTPVKSQSLGH